MARGYFLYVSQAQRWVMIHRESCTHAQHRASPTGAPSWQGPFDTLGEALKQAQQTGLQTNMCRHCKPEAE